MFCPNCGAKNSVEQNYCRGCGLKLEGVVEAVAEQFPSEEYAALQRRKERFGKLGVLSLSIAGFVGFSLLLVMAAEYKMILFGPEVIIWSAIFALIGFLLLSVFFFAYSNFFLKQKERPHVIRDVSKPADTAAANTAKLIEDGPADYVSSVTEHTTKGLHVPRERSGS
jgi:hypothetical protein